VNHVERLHNADYAIASVIVISQIIIGRCLIVDWWPRLSQRLVRVVTAAMIAIWITTATGIYFTFNTAEAARWVPTPVHAAISATEILWGFTSSLVMAIYLTSRFVLRRLPASFSPARRQWMTTAATVAMAAPVAATAFGALIERTNFHVKEIDFPVPNLHPDFEGLRVAQVSDLHVSPYLSVRDAARAVDMTNELKPHLTLVTGDIISEAGDPLDATIAEIARLRADMGVLGCLGNHEIYADCEDYVTEQSRRFGIEFLRMEARQLRRGNGTLNVAGVDFQPFREKSRYLEGADKLIVPGMANLLMSHNPDVFPVAARQGFDGVISGHTHGGQVTVEILRQTLNVVRFFTPYVAGLYRQDGRSCYVTAGIGTIGMPVRLGAQPEITLLRLRRA
jgi:predicted MPP superfamily phosphohydrolase